MAALATAVVHLLLSLITPFPPPAERALDPHDTEKWLFPGSGFSGCGHPVHVHVRYNNVGEGKEEAKSNVVEF